MPRKKCNDCGSVKREDSFYKNSKGISSYCKKCTRKRTLSWKKRFPDRKRAHVLVANAIKNKTLTRPKKCSQCLKKSYVVAHHPNYSKPLKVVWLCDSCHRKVHCSPTKNSISQVMSFLGSSKSKKKVIACKINGKLGGRPRKK